jgi:hypothetical protein
VCSYRMMHLMKIDVPRSILFTPCDYLDPLGRYRDFKGIFTHSSISRHLNYRFVLMSITPLLMKIFRSHFSMACTWTVANIPQNYNSLGSWLGGKMGVRKKIVQKNFFSRNFSASFLTLYCRHLGSKTRA